MRCRWPPVAKKKIHMEKIRTGVDQTVHAFDLRDGARSQQCDLAMRDLDPLAPWCHLLCVTPDGCARGVHRPVVAAGVGAALRGRLRRVRGA